MIWWFIGFFVLTGLLIYWSNLVAELQTYKTLYKRECEHNEKLRKILLDEKED